MTPNTNFHPNIVYNPQSFVVSDMLYSAYRMAQALKKPGQGLSGSELQEGLDVLNAMVDGWKAESLLVPYYRRSIQNMVANQESYSVGAGQDFDIEPPPKIHRAGFIIGTLPQNIAEIPMNIVTSFTEWAAITIKEVQSTLPLVLYYQYATPFAVVRVWPVPSQNSTIAIYTPQYISEFNTPQDEVDMPVGFREMLLYNLAVRVHERYPDKPMDPVIPMRAMEYKSRVKAMLLQPMFIGSDPAAIQESYRKAWFAGTPKAWSPYY